MQVTCKSFLPDFGLDDPDSNIITCERSRWPYFMSVSWGLERMGLEKASAWNWRPSRQLFRGGPSRCCKNISWTLHFGSCTLLLALYCSILLYSPYLWFFVTETPVQWFQTSFTFSGLSSSKNLLSTNYLKQLSFTHVNLSKLQYCLLSFYYRQISSQVQSCHSGFDTILTSYSFHRYVCSSHRFSYFYRRLRRRNGE